MASRQPVLRSTAVFGAWLGVTTVAAIGSWLGMSAVFSDQTSQAHIDMLLSQPTTEPEPTLTETSSEPSSPTSEVLPPPLPPQPDESTSSSSSPSPSSSPTMSPEPEEGYDNWYLVDYETYEATFNTQGGTATVQARSDESVFISASPMEGYTVEIEQTEPDYLIVYFYGTEKMITVEVMWENGPAAEITTVS